MDVRQAEIEAWKWHVFFGFSKSKRKPKWKRAQELKAKCDRINAERDAIRERGGHPDG